MTRPAVIVALALAGIALQPAGAPAAHAQDEPGSGAAPEAARDTDPDTDPDPDPEAHPDPDPEAEADTEADPDPDTEADPDPDPEADTEAGTDPDPEAETDTGTDPDTGTVPAEEAGTPTDSGPTAEAPKVAIVLVGDPDERLRSLARRVDRALEPALRRPFDPGLRAALRGEPGARDDGLGAVRRERRRLGLSEASDAPTLATLGRRAGAVAVAVVRAGDEGPELLILDVRRARFFEGTLPLNASVRPARIQRFVARRAAVSARGRGEAARVPAPDQAPAEALAPDETPAEEDQGEPGFFEQYWPYMVAAALLGGMIAAIAATSAADSSDQPVLRFVPGGS